MSESELMQLAVDSFNANQFAMGIGVAVGFVLLVLAFPLFYFIRTAFKPDYGGEYLVGITFGVFGVIILTAFGAAFLWNANYRELLIDQEFVEMLKHVRIEKGI